MNLNGSIELETPDQSSLNEIKSCLETTTSVSAKEEALTQLSRQLNQLSGESLVQVFGEFIELLLSCLESQEEVKKKLLESNIS